MSILETLLSVVAVAASGLSLYAAAGGYLPFAIGLAAVRIRERSGAVELTSFDAPAMFVTGFVVWALPGFAAPWGWTAVIGAAVLLLPLWLSFRIRARTTEAGVVVERKVFWVIPYRRGTSSGSASLVVDGWGDMADPEALTLSIAEGLEYEIGWSTASDGDRAQRLADEFNAKVAARAPAR